MKTRLKEIRQKQGLTQKQTAELLKVSESYYQKIEGGFSSVGYGFIKRFREVYPNEDITALFFE